MAEPDAGPDARPAPQDGARPRRPRADAERNRARLLDAARTAYTSGGPVVLEQIARDADVGIGTLYRHFPTREALVEALYREELGALCASAASLLEAHGATGRGPEAALRAWMERFADYVTAKREMADALRVVFASREAYVSDARPKLARAVELILDAGARAGTMRPDVRADDVVAMIVGMFTATSPEGGREQLERMFDLLADAVRQRAEGTAPGNGHHHLSRENSSPVRNAPRWRATASGSSSIDSTYAPGTSA